MRSPDLLKKTFICSFQTNSPCYQTVRARELKFWENVHTPPCVTCQVSCIMCHVSGVTCQVSHVRCCMLFFIYLFIFFGKRAEVSCWRVCYQRSLLRLVFERIESHFQARALSLTPNGFCLPNTPL